MSAKIIPIPTSRNREESIRRIARRIAAERAARFDESLDFLIEDFASPPADPSRAALHGRELPPAVDVEPGDLLLRQLIQGGPVPVRPPVKSAGTLVVEMFGIPVDVGRMFQEPKLAKVIPMKRRGE